MAIVFFDTTNNMFFAWKPLIFSQSVVDRNRIREVFGLLTLVKVEARKTSNKKS